MTTFKENTNNSQVKEVRLKKSIHHFHSHSTKTTTPEWTIVWTIESEDVQAERQHVYDVVSKS